MNEQVDTTATDNAYVGFRKLVGQIIGTLEHYSSRFFGDSCSPFTLTGALILGLVVVNIITGIIILSYYTPTPELASTSLRNLTIGFTFGKMVRSIHRASADIMILCLIFHMLRVWSTGRYYGPRSKNWVIGLIALPLIGIIGWAGYILPWDERAMVLLSWGRELVYGIDKWPILGWFKIGSIFGNFVFGAANESDQLLRILGLHIGSVFILIFIALLHLKRITPPRAKLPVVVWIGLVLILLLVAAMIPLEREELVVFNAFAPPSSVRVDSIISFPLLFYNYFGAPLLTALIIICLIALAFLPKLERRNIPTAVVSETACTGCRICYDDCPYAAIEMIPHSNPANANKGYEIARIISGNCNSCGICVGSCEYDAIELPTLTSSDIVNKIRHAVHPESPEEVGE